MKLKILILGIICFAGIMIGVLMQALASPGTVSNPGHLPNQIGGTSDPENTFASTGKYTFQGALTINGNLNVGCIGIEGGCLNGGNNWKCSSSAKSCRCDSGGDIAEVTCPDGTYVIAGGCDSDSGNFALTHNTARNDAGSPPNRWYCNWQGGVGWERARAICCRIPVTWDTSLRTPTD